MHWEVWESGIFFSAQTGTRGAFGLVFLSAPGHVSTSGSFGHQISESGGHSQARLARLADLVCAWGSAAITKLTRGGVAFRAVQVDGLNDRWDVARGLPCSAGVAGRDGRRGVSSRWRLATAAAGTSPSDTWHDGRSPPSSPRGEQLGWV